MLTDTFNPSKASRSLSPRILESHPVHCTGEALAYDALVQSHAWIFSRPFVKMLSKIKLERGRVLDVGTGPGWIPIELARRHPGWEFWAVDASEDTLAHARAHAARAGVSDRIHFIQGNATHLPFDTGRFDLSVSHYMLHHLERPEDLFNELARVTHGGGRIVVKDLLRHTRWKTAVLTAFSKYVLRYNATQLRMYRESLSAALSYPEVQAALKKSNLSLAHLSGFQGLEFVITA